MPQWSSSTIVATTVLDEVLTTARAVGMVEVEAEARARALLDLLDLAHLSRRTRVTSVGASSVAWPWRRRWSISPRCCSRTRPPSGMTGSPGRP